MTTKKINANSDDASPNIVSADYIVGALETDGTMAINFAMPGKTIKPEIRFSSKSNTNTLELFADFCKDIGVNPKYEKGVASVSGKTFGRAPCVRVGGRNQVLKFIEALSKSKIGFTGQKYRDLLLLKTALEQPLSDAEKIAIKKSLHKNNRNDPDLKTSNQTKSREYYEGAMGIPKGSSYTDGEKLLAAIDKECNQRREELEKAMANRSLVIPPDYFKGLMDGDGSIGIAISIKDEVQMEFGLNVSLAIDGQSKILADIFKYVLQSKAQITEKQSRKNPGQISAYAVCLCNQKENQNLFDFYEKNGPPLGDLRSRQLELALEFIELKRNGRLRDYSIVEPFVDKLYEYSASILKGKKRAPKEEVLKAFKKYCQQS